MSDKIKIRHVHGGTTGNKLKDCYFVPAGDGTYEFYDKDNDNPNNPLQTGIRDGSIFQFSLMDYPDLPWQLDVKSITEERAHGEWFAGMQSLSSPAEEEGSGTFQAQAGGATVPEDASSSATA